MQTGNSSLFSLRERTAVVTGGTGVLGGAIAAGLAAAGAKVAILGRRKKRGEALVEAIKTQGGEAIVLEADVLDVQSLRAGRDRALERWSRIDILVNGAGGNTASATVFGERTFFDLDQAAMDEVWKLNFQGTLLPSQVFGQTIAATSNNGSIINISSMSGQKPLTRVIGYSAAKAAVENFTKWLAIEFARKPGLPVRVNAIAPGFFIGEQNRRLLINEDDSLTERGERIIDHTPMGRFGEPEELVGTAVWLASDAAKFITGIVVPVDGGFSAYRGV
jgi:NAD(P)-dependent dehydrogenase (short-subunit alcohol dehydrogenase family)